MRDFLMRLAITGLYRARWTDAIHEEWIRALIDSLNLPDPDDRHVLAAAIKTRAHVIVTLNLSDFPASELHKYEIEAQPPDTFARHVVDLSPSAACRAAREQRASLKNPAMGVDEFLDKLEATGLPLTVAELRKYSDLL